MGAKFSGESLSLGGDFAHDDFLRAVGDEDLDHCEADGAAAEDQDGGILRANFDEGGGGDGVPGYREGFNEGCRGVSDCFKFWEAEGIVPPVSSSTFSGKGNTASHGTATASLKPPPPPVCHVSALLFFTIRPSDVH